MSNVRTQNMTVGLSLYLGSQSICIVGFGFPTIGGSMLGSPNTLPFPKIPPLNSQSCSLSPSNWLFFSLSILSRIANPLFPIESLIYSSRLMKGLWLFQVISEHGGPIPLPLNGCLVGSGDNGFGTGSHLRGTFGNDIPRAIPGSWDILSPSIHVPG